MENRKINTNHTSLERAQYILRFQEIKLELIPKWKFIKRMVILSMIRDAKRELENCIIENRIYHKLKKEREKM